MLLEAGCGAGWCLRGAAAAACEACNPQSDSEPKPAPMNHAGWRAAGAAAATGPAAL